LKVQNSEDCETIPAILCKQLDEGIGFYPFLGPHKWQFSMDLLYRKALLA
jgi:hypothetical protein